jgi:hypothetical protein
MGIVFQVVKLQGSHVFFIVMMPERKRDPDMLVMSVYRSEKQSTW